MIASTRCNARWALPTAKWWPLGPNLGLAKSEINASGLLVLPGGVEGHCHIEQRGTHGVMTADDFYTGTVSAVFGGTTTVLPFAAQSQEQSLRQVVKDYSECARPKAVNFTQIANGLPGIELRMPLLFSEGVSKGRIDLHQFVALTSTNPAKIYGLYPRKGSITIGGDADIAIWDPNKEVTITRDILHDACGYTPYEGMRVKGWPITVLSSGRITVRDEELKVAKGSGQFLKRELSSAAKSAWRFGIGNRSVA